MTKQKPKRKRLPVKQEWQLHQRIARRLSKEMEPTHKGQWVGLVNGEVVATGATIEEVSEALRKVESDPSRRFIFRVGKEYWRKVTIILTIKVKGA